MARLWLKIIRNNKITEQLAIDAKRDEAHEALIEMCKQLDLPNPIWLNKHESEYERFGLTAFKPEHFVESVDFQRMEIAYLEDDDKKRRSNDPRNQF